MLVSYLSNAPRNCLPSLQTRRSKRIVTEEQSRPRTISHKRQTRPQKVQILILKAWLRSQRLLWMKRNPSDLTTAPVFRRLTRTNIYPRLPQAQPAQIWDLSQGQFRSSCLLEMTSMGSVLPQEELLEAHSSTPPTSAISP